jgi:hypothetical protein
VFDPLVQLIPEGLLVTVPVPAPARLIVRPSPAVKVALTVAAAVIFNKHVVAVPEQLPPQPEKKSSLPVVSVRVTCVFWVKLPEHVVGQLIPAGLLVIVPMPEAGAVTVSWYVGVVVVVVVVVVVLGLPPQPARTRRLDKPSNNFQLNIDCDSMAPLRQTDKQNFDEVSRAAVGCQGGGSWRWSLFVIHLQEAPVTGCAQSLDRRYGGLFAQEISLDF